MTVSPIESDSRWKPRPVVAVFLRAVVAIAPIAVGYLIASIVAASFHPQQRLAWWLAVLGSAVAFGWLTFIATARLRLLAMLYDLGISFPGRAPDRWDVVKKAKDPIVGRRKLRGNAMGRDQNLDAAAVTAMAMAVTLPLHDRRASRHPHRIVDYTDLIARQLRLGDGERDRLKWAALCHGIGKLLLDPALLAKPGQLTPEEQATWETYPSKGMRLIGPLAAWLGTSAGAIESHAENWDGSGFPDRISEETVPIAARIVAVAASLDLLTTGSGSLSHDAARRQIAAASATDFDPLVVRAFLQISPGDLRAAAGSLSRMFPERMVAFLGRPGPVLALTVALLVTSGASLAGALLPIPDLSTIDPGAFLAMITSDREEPTTTSTAGPDQTTVLAAETTTSTSIETTTSDPSPVTSTTRGPRSTTTTSPGTTSTSGVTTTTTPGTTSTSTPSTTTTTRASTTTTSTTTSTTQQLVSVPNVVGLTQAAAVAAIESVGLVALPTTSSHPSVPDGEVISQNPSDGVQVAPDTTIQIVVSTGPQQFTLPDVSGDLEADAVNELSALGLDTTVMPETSAVAIGLVIRTDPPAGSTMIAGDAVTIWVSSGP